MQFFQPIVVFSFIVGCFVIGCGSPPPTTVNEEGRRVDPAVDPAFYEESGSLDPLAPAK